MLCISGFMDDVTFGRNGPYGDAWKAEPLTLKRAEISTSYTLPFRSNLHFYRASICEGGLGSRNSVRPSVCPSV